MIVQCRDELKALFATCPGVDQVLGKAERPPAFELQAPILSLPWLFGTTLETIPAQAPYLSAPAQRAAPRVVTETRDATLKVGIAWGGNPPVRRNRFRSCTLADFAPLTHMNGIQLFSLQKGAASKELGAHPDFAGVLDLGRTFCDFADPAAAMQALDLIITTDTSVAHLAGALGRPVWVLLSFVPDWRWLLERDDSPWYPTMRLFRQRRHGDWAEVFERATQAIATSNGVSSVRLKTL